MFRPRPPEEWREIFCRGPVDGHYIDEEGDVICCKPIPCKRLDGESDEDWYKRVNRRIRSGYYQNSPEIRARKKKYHHDWEQIARKEGRIKKMPPDKKKVFDRKNYILNTKPRLDRERRIQCIWNGKVVDLTYLTKKIGHAKAKQYVATEEQIEEYYKHLFDNTEV